MTKRLIIAYLWIAALWSLGSIVEEAVGLSDTLGLALGIVAAVAIVAMPASLWGRHLLGSTNRPERTVEPTPSGSRAIPT